MSEQHEVIAALEARIEELERRPHFPRLRVSRGVVVLLTLALFVPGIALASHGFTDVPTSHPFHNEISWVAEKNIANGFDDGTYRPSQAVTRQAMAAFLQRVGTASPMEEEPNNSFAAADIYPPDGPAMGGVMSGQHDVWRISHTGGWLRAETQTLDCFHYSRNDTHVYVYNSSGSLVADDDDIGGTPTNRCSQALTGHLAAGDYYVEVHARNGDVPFYALMVVSESGPLGADAQAPAP